jgi:hypothetical protein
MQATLTDHFGGPLDPDLRWVTSCLVRTGTRPYHIDAIVSGEQSNRKRVMENHFHVSVVPSFHNLNILEM